MTVLHSPRDSDDFSGAELRPVVVILHGVDGMVGESETEIRKLTTQVADDGYVVFVPHYFGAERPGAGMPSEEVLFQRTMTVDSFRPPVARRR